MGKISAPKEKEDPITNFLAKVFGITSERFLTYIQPPDRSAEIPTEMTARMPAVMSLKNQPEFNADAPWRLEPDQDSLPITIYIRDANIQSPGYSPWRVDNLLIEQSVEQGHWFKLATIIPPISPGINSQGDINQDFWVHSIQIPISEIQNWSPGNDVHLRVKFTGSPYPHQKTSTLERHIEILRAEYALPLGRAANSAGSRKWFYGDTHYHSAYTNDIKEFGAPILETRAAGQAIGLDWLVITDHSTDLDEIDEGYDRKSRWERLKTELSSSAISDDRFRFLLGEEISLIGKDNRFVHMLAIGALDKMIEGAFLPEVGNTLATNLWQEAIESIIKHSQGYPANILKQLFGKVNHFENVLALLPDNSLTFAAHPYSVAQVPPAKWDEQDLSHARLTGHEFWNGRTRKSAKQTDNPFATKGWTDPVTLKSRDDARITKLLQLVGKKWEPHLIRGVEEWKLGAPLPSRRPVFVGGSDAHGDFNYHAGMAWDYTKVDMIDDNALGRVRTAIFLPEHQSASVPYVDEILAALKTGSCVVTDGPILEFHLQHKGQIAYMGESLFVSGDGDPEMKIVAHSTPEFGPVTQVDVVTYFKGQKSKKSTSVTLEQGKHAIVQLAGVQGYYRLQAQTVGMDGERFCCFTNPIWLWLTEGSDKAVHIDFS